MTPTAEDVQAPDSTLYQVWARQSTDHIDLSITNIGEASVAYDSKYDKVLYHPTDETCDALVASVQAAIVAGQDLPEGIYKQG